MILLPVFLVKWAVPDNWLNERRAMLWGSQGNRTIEEAIASSGGKSSFANNVGSFSVQPFFMCCQFAMEANFLHIWPREEFMLIGLPNVNDNSFVATLFMPFTMFDSLTSDQKVLEFFEKTFPDAVSLIGRWGKFYLFCGQSPCWQSDWPLPNWLQTKELLLELRHGIIR